LVSYVAMLDVPKELIHHLARLLAAHRKTRGTRRGRRALTCHRQALLILVWFRKAEDPALLGAGFGISRATAYRYLTEGITVLTAHSPDLHQALRRAADDGWAFVILDGKVFRTDRCAQLTANRDGKPVHAWYSGKHRCFGGNIQALIRPDGLPIWTSPVTQGRVHDLTMAAELGILAALYWAADHLDLPTLADLGYHGTGPGIHTPVKLPIASTQLTGDQQAYNKLQRGLRAPGERGFACSSAGGKSYATSPPARAASAPWSKPP
jgi:hypothetical protein